LNPANLPSTAEDDDKETSFAGTSEPVAQGQGSSTLENIINSEVENVESKSTEKQELTEEQKEQLAELQSQSVCELQAS
jgi:hypothetical protein